MCRIFFCKAQPFWGPYYLKSLATHHEMNFNKIKNDRGVRKLIPNAPGQHQIPSAAARPLALQCLTCPLSHTIEFCIIGKTNSIANQFVHFENGMRITEDPFHVLGAFYLFFGKQFGASERAGEITSTKIMFLGAFSSLFPSHLIPPHSHHELVCARERERRERWTISFSYYYYFGLQFFGYSCSQQRSLGIISSNKAATRCAFAWFSFSSSAYILLSVQPAAAVVIIREKWNIITKGDVLLLLRLFSLLEPRAFAKKESDAKIIPFYRK